MNQIVLAEWALVPAALVLVLYHLWVRKRPVVKAIWYLGLHTWCWPAYRFVLHWDERFRQSEIYNKMFELRAQYLERGGSPDDPTFPGLRDAHRALGLRVAQHESDENALRRIRFDPYRR